MKLVVKYLLVMVAAITLVIVVAACTPVNQDIPKVVVEWSETNVWKVLRSDGGTGSSFWLNNKTLITACHVVNNRETVYVQSFDRSKLFLVKVKSCSEQYDLALLEYDKEYDSLETAITRPLPRGTGMYGPGYPLGDPLFIVQGHWQSRNDIGYSMSVPITFGDSGSPALTILNGRVVVTGVRTNGASVPVGYGTYVPIVHISSVRDSIQIIKFLRDNEYTFTEITPENKWGEQSP